MRGFIVIFATVLQRLLFSLRQIQSILSSPIYLKSIVFLSNHSSLVLPIRPFPSGFPLNKLAFFSHTCYRSLPSRPLFLPHMLQVSPISSSFSPTHATGLSHLILFFSHTWYRSLPSHPLFLPHMLQVSPISSSFSPTHATGLSYLILFGVEQKS